MGMKEWGKNPKVAKPEKIVKEPENDYIAPTNPPDEVVADGQKFETYGGGVRAYKSFNTPKSPTFFRWGVIVLIWVMIISYWDSSALSFIIAGFWGWITFKEVV